jgi:hypothetical protein
MERHVGLLDNIFYTWTYLSEYMEERLSRRSFEALSEFKTTKCVPKSSM